MKISPNNWQVLYSKCHDPKALMKYTEYFRVEYIPYDIYDDILNKYFASHSLSGPLNICSLGCGMGQHEINLSKKGHRIIGIDKNEESIGLASNNAKKASEEIIFYQADIFDTKAMNSILKKYDPFDVVIMIGVGGSTHDHGQIAMSMLDYIKKGGLFITGLWGYNSDFDKEKVTQLSDIEIANSPDKQDYCVRISTYTYEHEKDFYYIKWDAVYLYPDEENLARIQRTQSLIAVNPEELDKDPLDLPDTHFEHLSSRRLLECGEMMTFPHTYEYLAGWRKK